MKICLVGFICDIILIQLLFESLGITITPMNLKIEQCD
jgi:hypothetical protein